VRQKTATRRRRTSNEDEGGTYLSSLKADSLAERNFMADAKLPEDASDDPSSVASSDLCERSMVPRRALSVVDVVDVVLAPLFRRPPTAALLATWSLNPLKPAPSARTNHRLECA